MTGNQPVNQSTSQSINDGRGWGGGECEEDGQRRRPRRTKGDGHREEQKTTAVGRTKDDGHGGEQGTTATGKSKRRRPRGSTKEHNGGGKRGREGGGGRKGWQDGSERARWCGDDSSKYSAAALCALAHPRHRRHHHNSITVAIQRHCTRHASRICSPSPANDAPEAICASRLLRLAPLTFHAKRRLTGCMRHMSDGH